MFLDFDICALIIHANKQMTDEPKQDSQTITITPVSVAPIGAIRADEPKVEPLGEQRSAESACGIQRSAEPTCAIAINESRIGEPYKKFSDLISKGQATLKYIEFLDQKARNQAIIAQLRAGSATLAPMARYQQCASQLPSRDTLFAMDAASAQATRQQVQRVLTDCGDELRYLYHLYIDECLDVEIARVRDILLKLQ